MFLCHHQLCPVVKRIGIQFLSRLQPKQHLLERPEWVQLLCAGVCLSSQLKACHNELQLTFYNCNICWTLAAVTFLSSLRSFPPTDSSAFSIFPPDLQASSPVQLALADSLAAHHRPRQRINSVDWVWETSCLPANLIVNVRHTALFALRLSHVPPSPKWQYNFCNELMVLCYKSLAVMMLKQLLPDQILMIELRRELHVGLILRCHSLIQLHLVKINISPSISFRRESTSCNYSDVSDSKIH